MDPISDEQSRRIVAIAMDLARAGNTDELLEFFDHGLPINTVDAGGNTALMLAAYHGQAATVRALVGRGADVDRRNHRDQSPIAGALFKGEDEVVGLLRDAGADLDAGTPSARAAADMFGRTRLLTPEPGAATHGAANDPTSDPTTDPTSDLTEENTMDRTPGTAAALADLAGVLNVDVDEITVVSEQRVTWRDSSAGCPQPGFMYAQVLTNGSRIVLEHSGQRYEYHSAGDRAPFRCSDPQPPLEG